MMEDIDLVTLLWHPQDRKWSCMVDIRVETSEQFTKSESVFVTDSRWIVLSFIKGVFGAWQAIRRINDAHREARRKNGWL